MDSHICPGGQNAHDAASLGGVVSRTGATSREGRGQGENALLGYGRKMVGGWMSGCSSREDEEEEGRRGGLGADERTKNGRRRRGVGRGALVKVCKNAKVARGHQNREPREEEAAG